MIEFMQTNWWIGLIFLAAGVYFLVIKPRRDRSQPAPQPAFTPPPSPIEAPIPYANPNPVSTAVPNPVRTTPATPVAPDLIGSTSLSAIQWAQGVKKPPIVPGMLGAFAYYCSNNWVALIGKTYDDAYKAFITQPSANYNPGTEIPEQFNNAAYCNEVLARFDAEQNTGVRFYKILPEEQFALVGSGRMTWGEMLNGINIANAGAPPPGAESSSLVAWRISRAG